MDKLSKQLGVQTMFESKKIENYGPNHEKKERMFLEQKFRLESRRITPMSYVEYKGIGQICKYDSKLERGPNGQGEEETEIKNRALAPEERMRMEKTTMMAAPATTQRQRKAPSEEQRTTERRHRKWF